MVVAAVMMVGMLAAVMMVEVLAAVMMVGVLAAVMMVGVLVAVMVAVTNVGCDSMAAQVAVHPCLPCLHGRQVALTLIPSHMRWQLRLWRH